MPRSILLGRPWPKPGEPLFLPDDTDGALALRLEEDETCTGCGHPMSESMKPGNDDAYGARKLTCFACAAIDRAKADLMEEPGSTHGIRISATRLEEA